MAGTIFSRCLEQFAADDLADERVESAARRGGPAHDPGDRVAVVESEARAREISDYRARMKRDMAAARVGAGAVSTGLKACVCMWCMMGNMADAEITEYQRCLISR